MAVGLGPGDPALVTEAALAALRAERVRFVRTEVHPSAHLAAPASSFDGAYEAATSLEEVYALIVEELVAAARREGRVLYAVPGSPLVAERSVDLLRADPRVEVEIVPGLSFLDLAWERLGVDPLAAGVRLVDGHRFAVEAAGERGPLLVAQCDSRLVLSEVKLAAEEPPRGSVTVLQRLGTPEESVREVSWDDLDREVEPDHLTCLYLPEMEEPVAAELARFIELVRTLRERCPWDRVQTHASLTRHLLEEAYEVVEAIEELDTPGGYLHLEEELGDLLFQVVFHARLASEAGQFGMADVARGIHEKLVRRHPHVFGGDPKGWEQIKAAEKGRRSVMDGVAANLPSLLYAHKVQYKAATLGFDPWDARPAPLPPGSLKTAPRGEAVEAKELGDELFSLVATARRRGVDPEAALRAAAGAFRRRVERMEAVALRRGLELGSLDAVALAALWEQAGAEVDRREGASPELDGMGQASTEVDRPEAASADSAAREGT